MRECRFTEAQIIGMFKKQQAGMPAVEVCRKHGLSQGTFSKFNSKYGDMKVFDAAKLKRLLPDQMLDNVVLNDLLRKN